MPAEENNNTPHEQDNKLGIGLSEGSAKILRDSISRNLKDDVEAIIGGLHPADIADFIEESDEETREKLINIIGNNKFDAEILSHISPDLVPTIRDLLGDKTSAQAIAKLDSEDVVQVLEELDSSEQQEILESLPEQFRRVIEEGLTYPEDSVGRMMHRKFISVPQYWNVGQTIDYLRKFEDLPDDFHEIFVVNPKHQPLKYVLVSRILRSKRETKIDDISYDCKHQLAPEVDQEEAAYLFRQYGLVTAPVVNSTGQLIGTLEIDNIATVINEEAEEDLLKMGGVSESDIFSATGITVKRRFPWLFLNLLTALLSALIVFSFGATIEQMVALAALMPIVASMSGNAGTQTLTVAVRAISNKELTPANTRSVINKEILVGIYNALGISIIAGGLIMLALSDIKLAITFTVATLVSFAAAGLSGALIPVTLHRYKIDPAISSGVILMAITDIISFFTFLGLASIVLI